TAADMLRFIEANMNSSLAEEKLHHAIVETHTAYFTAGVMTQDLIWEQYPYPSDLKTLLQGNSPAMIFKSVPATPVTPPAEPREDVLLDKTGSTNGFGAYVAFIPAKRLGIVILANKNYSIEGGVRLAYEIVAALAG